MIHSIDKDRLRILIKDGDKFKSDIINIINGAALSNEEVLDLGGMFIHSLPLEIGKLTNLKMLFINDNLLTYLPPEIGQLVNLELLYIHNNLIESLPYEITKLQNLIEFRFDDNPLTNPPLEICSRGIREITNYINAKKNDHAKEVKVYEAKLIVVGQGGVGKTCLCNRLINDQFDENEDTTKGISIKNWHVSAIGNNMPIKINVWDFGGQEIYHATHQFFLTKRTIYLVVWDARQENEYGRLDYWLHTVESFGGNSPIILVLNKCEDLCQFINLKDLKEKFPQIVAYFRVSCKKPDNGPDSFCKLKETITRVACSLPHMGSDWINSWLEVRKLLECDNRLNIELKDYLDICYEHGIKKDCAMTLSMYLHDLGVILHFQEDFILKHTIILNPEWATKGVYKILDSQLPKNRQGILLEEDLEKIWREEDGYPADRYGTLLRLMSNFELSFVINDTNNFIIAELLPKEPVDFCFPPNEKTISFQYHYSFMPAGILPRFIVRIHEEIERTQTGTYLCWHQGVILKIDDSRAYIKSDPYERIIYIKVYGEKISELIYLIRKEFDHINDKLKNISITSNIPCNCSIGCSQIFDYENILKAYKMNRKSISCHNTLNDVSIQNLLIGFNHVLDSLSLINKFNLPNTIIEEAINEKLKKNASKESHLISINGGHNVICNTKNGPINFRQKVTNYEVKSLYKKEFQLIQEIENLSTVRNDDKTNFSNIINEVSEEVVSINPDTNDIVTKLNRAKEVLESSGEVYEQSKKWCSRFNELITIIKHLIPSVVDLFNN